MDAAKARELVNLKKNSSRIDDLVADVLRRIEVAATDGKNYILDPLYHLRTRVTEQEHREVRKKIRDLDFTYEDMDDNNKPCPGIHSTIHW